MLAVASLQLLRRLQGGMRSETLDSPARITPSLMCSQLLRRRCELPLIPLRVLSADKNTVSSLVPLQPQCLLKTLPQLQRHRRSMIRLLRRSRHSRPVVHPLWLLRLEAVLPGFSGQYFGSVILHSTTGGEEGNMLVSSGSEVMTRKENSHDDLENTLAIEVC